MFPPGLPIPPRFQPVPDIPMPIQTSQDQESAPKTKKKKRNDKGKTKATTRKRKASKAHSQEPEAKKGKGGRPMGSSNFTKEDLLEGLLPAVRETLPAGAKGWKRIGEAFNEYAASVGRPSRPFKSLENKFKQVCFLAACSLSRLTHFLRCSF